MLLLQEEHAQHDAQREGAQFTSFTGTKVQILKVQILTPAALQLAATEYIKTVYKYDRMVALAIIFALFLLARPPYELRLWVHSKLVSQRIHQHASAHVSGASGGESGATPGAAPRQGAPGLRLAQAAGVLSAVRRWRRRSVDGLPAPMDPDLNHHIFEQRKHAICISFGAYLVAVGNMLVGVFRSLDCLF